MASDKNNQPAVGQDDGLDPTEVIRKPYDEPSKQSSTMPGYFIDEDSEFAPTNKVRTLLLLGRRGRGKSATGNSILGDEKFKSESGFGPVTSICEFQSTVLENGLTLNVIDTPGSVDYSAVPEFIEKDFVRCLDMAKDGIHAVVLVLLATARFTRIDAAAIMSLQNLFGDRIFDYMVLVFTRGDHLDGLTLDDLIARGCPQPMRECLEKCGNRKVLFDNKSKDKVKRAEQLNELLFLVDEVVSMNGGKTFADEIFAELKKKGGEQKVRDHAIEVDSLLGNPTRDVYKEEFFKHYKQHLIRLNNMVKEKMKDTILRLGLHVTEEQEARWRPQAIGVAGQKKSVEEAP